MPLTQVSWVWVWIPTKTYERSNLRVPEFQPGNHELFEEDGVPPMEDLVDEVLKTLVVERKTEQYSQDENFKLIQFCIKDEVTKSHFKVNDCNMVR